MRLRASFDLAAVLFFTASLSAQSTFVFTNNDPFPPRPNSVSAFWTDKNGGLTPLAGSPFMTGGLGGGGGFTASNRIVVVGSFLYASNSVTNDVSGFSMDPETGALTPVPGSPFRTGGITSGGFSLAPTPDGRFLYAAQDYSATIRIFGIDPDDGHLTALGDPVPVGADISANGLKVSPDGKWLALSLSRVPPHGVVVVFSIDPETGELMPVPGSPFPVRDPGGPDGGVAGVDINCASSTLFVSEGTFGTTIVDVLSIDPDTGALTPIEGSPFAPGVGRNSNALLLSPDDSLLFVSNDSDNSVTVFTIGANGSLELVPGSPFRTGDGIFPFGMATDLSGAFLFVSATIPEGNLLCGCGVYVFTVDSSGALTPVAGSPFRAVEGLENLILSLAAVPGKSCPAQAK